jgi:hypothetical protein
MPNGTRPPERSSSNAVDRFETFTYDLIDHEPRSRKLQTDRVSGSQTISVQRKLVLTPTVTDNASFHEPLINFAFAHSIKSGKGVGELRAE